MLQLVCLNDVIHVYDSQNGRFIRKNASNVAQALNDDHGRSMKTMLLCAEWMRTGTRPGHYLALRQG